MPPKASAPPKMQQISPGQASWLCVIDKAQLTAEQRHQRDHLSERSTELARAYQLCQNFVEILRERKAEDLKEWLGCTRASQIPELQGLAKSIQQDY